MRDALDEEQLAAAVRARVHHLAQDLLAGHRRDRRLRVGRMVRSDRCGVAVDDATSADRLERTSHSLERTPST
jgi:hypothetical protein